MTLAGYPYAEKVSPGAVFLLMLLLPILGFGQKDPYDGLLEAIWLDSLTITAKKQGFDVEQFIVMVREDTSFLHAFRNLRIVPHRSRHEQDFSLKKGKAETYYRAETRLIDAGICREMQFLREDMSRDYRKKNGDRKYITAKLYEKVFFPQGSLCAEDERAEHAKQDGIIAYYYQELKRFIFQPGERASIPLIGGKTALFSERMRKFYRYGIVMKNFSDGTPCYVFTLKVRDEHAERKSGRTLVKFMETYFSRKDFQVMGRTYDVSHPGPLFSCDIHVEVVLRQLGKQSYIPDMVAYAGTWDIPGRKRETGRFKMTLLEIAPD